MKNLVRKIFGCDMLSMDINDPMRVKIKRKFVSSVVYRKNLAIELREPNIYINKHLIRSRP